VYNSETHTGGAQTYIDNVVKILKTRHKVVYVDGSFSKFFKSLIINNNNVVIHNLYKAEDFLAIFLSFLSGKRNIFIVHSIFFLVNQESGRNISYVRIFYEWICQYLMFIFSNRIIAVCKYEINQINKYFPFVKGKIVLAYGAADHEKYNSKQILSKSAENNRWHFGNDTKVLLMVSRIERRKGIHVAFKALNKLLKTDKRMVLLLIYPGGKFHQPDYFEELTKLTEKLDIGKYVYFKTGIKKENLKSYYLKSDILLLPSLENEYCSLSMMESLSCGLPVLSFNTGGTPEILKSMGDKFIVNKPDYKGLASRLKWYLRENESVIKKWKLKAIEVSRKYSWYNTSKIILDNKL
jgi:glycosyltransferase involved in cell wall biosynthesis